MFGHKVHPSLRADSNHIFRRHQGPVAMSAAQEEHAQGERERLSRNRRRRRDEGAGTSRWPNML